MNKVIVIGGGGHAKVVIDAIQCSKKMTVAGIVDSELKVGSSIAGCKVLGGDEYLGKKHANEYLVTIGVGIVRGDRKRRNIYEWVRERSYQFANVFHSSAIVGSGVQLRGGCQVLARAVIQTQCFIGENVIINTGAIVEHESRIGAHSHVGPGAVLGGGVTIGKCSFVGLGAIILPGIKIGDGVTVGAGSVVTKNIENGNTVFGNPARVFEVKIS